MDRLKRAVSRLPALLAFLYAGVVGVDGLYVGLLAPPEILSEYGFNGDGESWRMRSAGHYFWYAASVSLVFVFVGVGLKRLLTPRSQ
ncbi:MAG: hypothetical protein P8Q97_00505 [Myxococcota bacterium]|jgi:hypothetical protein|nr:hypothetical protein [Myxococcota bacterium]